jgi:glycosyltransferase involved in cell wall biosynthesis
VVSAYTIAHVSTQRGWHGGEEQARLLCEGLRNHGHRNVIFAKHDGQFAQRMFGAGFEVVPLVGSGRNLRAIHQMRRHWRKLKPNIVHFHDPHALSGGGLAAYGLRIPARIMARRVDFRIRSTWRYRHLVDRVIAVSCAVADVCKQSGMPAEMIRVVHDGVDPTRARTGDRWRGRQSLNIADDVKLLLTVATLTDHKGHKFLIEAMSNIVAQSQGKVQLVLAGDGELRDELQKLATERRLNGSVQFLGYRNDVPDLLKAADLFVLPSHMEGLCSTLIDVMIAKTPIVATTAGGIPDLLGARKEDRPVAILVPPSNPTALANAINHALADLPALQPMVAAAEQRAIQCFTDEQMVEGTLAVYRELAEC